MIINNKFENKILNKVDNIINYSKKDKLNDKLYKDSSNSNLFIIKSKNRLIKLKNNIIEDILSNNKLNIINNSIKEYKDIIVNIYNYYYSKLKYYKNNLKFDKINNSYYIINKNNLKYYYNNESIDKIKYIIKLYKNLCSNDFKNINFIIDKILNYNSNKFYNFII